VGKAVLRSYHPQGLARQLVAISASPDRVQLIRTITRPTLVIHGRDDPLVRVACGIDLANRIRGAELDIIDGMGHDLPPALVPRLAARLLAHFARA
jgi:proline iminopeptidase